MGMDHGRRLPALLRHVALMALLAPSACWAISPRLTQAGDLYRVTNTNDFSGWSQIPSPDGGKPGRSNFRGESKVVFRERAEPAQTKNGGLRLMRVYDTVTYSRTVDDRDETATLRPSIRRVNLDPGELGYVLYSPDGPLRGPEWVLLDEHVHLPILERFLKEGELAPGAEWEVPREALAELTGVDVIDEGAIRCKVEGPIKVKSRSFLQVSAVGSIIARTGPVRSRSSLRAGLYLDPDTGRLISMRAIGRQQTLGEDDAVIGEVDVDYQVLVEPISEDPDLSDEAIAKLPQEPTPELLMLDFETPELGVRLRHSRRWILQRIDGPRLFFAGPDVSLVLTVEPPGMLPSLDDYHREVTDYMKDQKIVAEVADPLGERTVGDGTLGHFAFKATVKDRPSRLDYWRWSVGDRGATAASNAATEAPAEAMGDLESIVTSMEFFPPTAPAPEAP